MAERADRMRQRYQEFSQGDLEAALQDWSDDFVWQGSNSTDLPGGGEHSGKDQAIKVLQEAVGAWDSFELTADEFLRGRRHGRRARAHGRHEGRQVGTGPRGAHLALGGRPGEAPSDSHRHLPDRTATRKVLRRLP